MPALFLLTLACTKAEEAQARKKTSEERIRIKTGIEVLKEQHFRPLKGKRVGLITNPTGVDNHLRSTIDLLHEAPDVQLVALYGPEHGVRGNQHAGESVTDVGDEATGLPVYSLFGKTRKATPEMLQGVDALVYDIQDIGCRSYTYISTMGLAMEAAAEQDKEFIVLDRPNPLGGLRVEGCITEDDCVSFVSQFPIPYVYGLTCGELARMLNDERMLSGGKACKLTVVPMKGWRREMTYADTGLPWIPASPHIPQPASAIAYPMSGILGEFSYLNIGVGYTLPFQMFAAPWIDADSLATRLNGLGLQGVIFRPIHAKPFYAAMQGEQVHGVQVHFTDYNHAPLTDIQFLVAQELAALWPEQALFKVADPKRFRMFDIVCGSKEIRERFARNHRWEDIRDYWYKDVDNFRRLSKKYYLYK
ncbi:MAG: DUF1343 domain-containing protein [Bacteroidaceae bacterium]|nr:DUF1343 domain-containing protein [Bacteroidaceae bacterium]